MKIYITARKDHNYPGGYVPSYRRTKPRKNLVMAVNVSGKAMDTDALNEAVCAGLMYIDSYARDRFTEKVLEGLR